MDGQMNRWMGKQMDGWVVRWIGGWMDGKGEVDG